MRVSRQLTAQQEAVAVEDGFYLLKSVESADHLVPFPRQVYLAHSGFQFGLGVEVVASLHQYVVAVCVGCGCGLIVG